MKIIKRRLVDRAFLESDSGSLHPVLQRVLAARGVYSTGEVDYALKNLLPFSDLSGIDRAVGLLVEAVEGQANIVIVADYDADGATSCAVAIKALQLMGAENVGYVVPNRERHGYGLTPAIVELTLPFTPQLLITVDNGISSVEGVAAARSLGIRVLVTDHHAPPVELPLADAIVNPNLRGDVFPSKALAGVGVIFYVMLALRACLRERGWFKRAGISEPNLRYLLDLVALGTIADVVPLDYNNRILVANGLRLIREGGACVGIRALLQVAGRQGGGISAQDLAFAVAPRLNAAGRMDDMSYGIACLLAEDEGLAQRLADALNEFNHERRYVEAEMQREAEDQLAVLQSSVAALPLGLCLYQPHWHQGVIGILAGRVKEVLHRPVIVFANSDAGEMKGSGRSVAGVHIKDVLESIARQEPHLIRRFGGHAMAAGLSLARESFDIFQVLFAREVEKYLDPVAVRQGVLYSDGELTEGDFSLALAEAVNGLSPWGERFPEPLFDGVFELVEYMVLKERHLKMQVRLPSSELILPAIAFNCRNWAEIVEYRRLHLTYHLAVNFFKDFKSIQLIIQHVAACEM